MCSERGFPEMKELCRRSAKFRIFCTSVLFLLTISTCFGSEKSENTRNEFQELNLLEKTLFLSTQRLDYTG